MGLVGWIIALGVALAGAIVLFATFIRRGRSPLVEPAQIEELHRDRRAELIRGTSLHLREMRYRYSIRIDRSERAPFSIEVNTVPLGFVPVIITDSADDRQGEGYVAFVYDGRRWRGPGLPCAGGPARAVEHAKRCVAPLSDAAQPQEW